MFKVVPDQLRVSDGWVRCGQCNEVFDANANLLAHPEEALTRADQTPPRIPDEAEQPSVPVDGDFPTEAVASTVESADAVVEDDDVPQDDEVAVAVADRFLEVNPHALYIEPEPQEITESPVEVDANGMPPEQEPALEPVMAEEALPTAEIEPQHSFMQTAKLPSQWDRPAARVGLSVLGAALAMVLLLQLLVQERDRIAATEPETKQFLEPLCALLNCTISPLRQIESVVIDSSSFVKVRSDVYRLNFTLKNTAQTAVATPALELTLTDLQDQAVARRVFVASELGAQQTRMEPGAELTASVPLAVKLNGNAERVSGYRLLSFYP